MSDFVRWMTKQSNGYVSPGEDDSTAWRPALVARVMLKRVCVLVLIALGVALLAVQTFDVTMTRLAQPVDWIPQDFWQLDDDDARVVDTLVREAAALPFDELPPMITGMFRTASPMFYVGDTAHPVRDALMQLGFAPAGSLHRVDYLSDSLLEFELAERLGVEGLQQHWEQLRTSKAEFLDFQNYLAALLAAWRSQAPVATVFSTDVSPAVSVFWDADYDQYITAVEDHAARVSVSRSSDWDVIVTSYHYDTRENFRTYYEAWRAGLPRTRAVPVNADFRGARAGIWRRRGLERMLRAFLAPGLALETLPEDLAANHSLIFDCARKPAELPGCAVSTLIHHVFGTPGDAAHPNTAWLLQPPLFGYRPLPEDTVTTGWKHHHEPGMHELQQAVADTFKWNAENCEVFEGLHAFLLLDETQQATIYRDAQQRYAQFLDTLPSGSPEPEKDEAALLAWRLQSFMPQADWIPKE
eukprot:Gregarina_sp_Pseudo_9__2465@NODE_274_length_3319_cov_11_965549_g257_i0_p1_GENE_NODE_274_length_3319_cov_11_965549_g257_i0NODE_274_length_3319_cov_11_965549_g257_i0_p1_ORF_typecomplete_len470_score164_49DUF3464/PF11947_8/0_64DUF3464/PF11947_8/2_9e03_NODE_274_length_3319_cov_11_965549_g257_i017563165